MQNKIGKQWKEMRHGMLIWFMFRLIYVKNKNDVCEVRGGEKKRSVFFLCHCHIILW